MRINEIITESQELEEGWKSKLGAAALAGAAMLGGGHQDAQAQNYQPTAQSQQRQVSRVNAQGQPTDHVRYMQRVLGFARSYHDAGLLSPEENKIYAKYANAASDIYKKMAPKWQQEADKNYSSGFNAAKGSMRGTSQQILRWNATDALKQVIAQDIKFGGGEGSGNFGVMLNPEAKSFYYK